MGSGDENQKSTSDPKGSFPFMSISAKQMEERDLLLDALLQYFSRKKLGAILCLKELLTNVKTFSRILHGIQNLEKIIINEVHCIANKHRKTLTATEQHIHPIY